MRGIIRIYGAEAIVLVTMITRTISNECTKNNKFGEFAAKKRRSEEAKKRRSEEEKKRRREEEKKRRSEEEKKRRSEEEKKRRREEAKKRRSEEAKKRRSEEATSLELQYEQITLKEPAMIPSIMLQPITLKSLQ